MKQRICLLLFIIFVLSSLLLEACNFSFQTLSTPTSLEILPTSTSSAPIAMQLSISPTFTPPSSTEVLPSATPTLISIRSDTIYMLETFMSVKQGEIVHALAFTPDSMVLASAGGNTEDFAIRLWDVASGQNIGTLNGHDGIVWAVAFSLDGEMLASVSSDNTAKVWDWRKGTLLKSLDFPSEVVSVSFSPDGQSLAVGGVDEMQNQIRNAAIWTYAVGSWEPLVKFPEYWNITAMAYSPDGSMLVGGGTSRNVQVWRARDGSPVYTFSHAHQVGKAAISPNGSTVATATCETVVNYDCTDGAVWLWDLSTGRLIKKLTGFPNIVVDVTFSADSSTLIVASRDGTLRFYDTSAYQTLFDFTSPGGISTLTVSPDGGLLATGNVNGDVTIWKNVYHP